VIQSFHGARISLVVTLLCLPGAIVLLSLNPVKAQTSCTTLATGCPLALQDPVSVSVGGGSVFVADLGTNTIVRLSRRGAVLGSWGGTGTRHGQFRVPGSIAVGHHTVYVADVRNRRIQAFSLSGRYLRSWFTPQAPAWWYTQSSFGWLLERIAADSTGDVVTLDPYMMLTKYSSSGHVLWTRRIAVQPQDRDSHGYPIGYSPLAVAIGPNGGIELSFAAHGPQNRGGWPEYLFVQRLDVHGRIIREWRMSPAFDAGRPLVATGITIVGRGRSWITEGGAPLTHSSLDEFNSHGAEVQSVGTQGCGLGLLGEPAGVASDRQGRLYIADPGNHSIEVFSETGKALAYWGTCPATAVASGYPPPGVQHGQALSRLPLERSAPGIGPPHLARQDVCSCHHPRSHPAESSGRRERRADR
jgi:tripartite motif-containing protein 71